jgi:hypothetical protein
VRVHPIEIPTIGRPYVMILPGGHVEVRRAVWLSYLDGFLRAEDVLDCAEAAS